MQYAQLLCALTLPQKVHTNQTRRGVLSGKYAVLSSLTFLAAATPGTSRLRTNTSVRCGALTAASAGPAAGPTAMAAAAATAAPNSARVATPAPRVRGGGGVVHGSPHPERYRLSAGGDLGDVHAGAGAGIDELYSSGPAFAAKGASIRAAANMGKSFFIVVTPNQALQALRNPIR